MLLLALYTIKCTININYFNNDFFKWSCYYKKHNSPIKVYVDNITIHNFTVCIHIWDSGIYRVGFSWLAYGEKNLKLTWIKY